MLMLFSMCASRTFEDKLLEGSDDGRVEVRSVRYHTPGLRNDGHWRQRKP